MRELIKKKSTSKFYAHYKTLVNKGVWGGTSVYFLNRSLYRIIFLVPELIAFASQPTTDVFLCYSITPCQLWELLDVRISG
jgi:hypothetical protein